MVYLASSVGTVGTAVTAGTVPQDLLVIPVWSARLDPMGRQGTLAKTALKENKGHLVRKATPD